MGARRLDDTASGAGGPTMPSAGRRRLPVAAALAAVVMGLAACAGADAPGAGSPPSEPAAPAETTGTSDGGTDPDVADTEVPLLRVHSRGGFLPPGWDFARVPELTVYPDGRAVTHGPQALIYPPPALPNLVLQALVDDDVDTLVAAARDAGLLDDAPVDYGRPTVADAGTTFVTLGVDGRTYRHAAEALSVVDGVDGMEVAPGAERTEQPSQPPEAPSPEAAAAWGLTEGQLAARARLAGFLAAARELVGAAQETGPYPVEAFALMARPAEDLTGAAPDDVAPQVLPWPLGLPLAEADGCVLVDGEDARTLREVLVGAGFTARFEQAGARYEAWFRPLLPHETTCDDVAE